MEEDHYGIPDVKERILEFIAVGAIKGNLTVKIREIKVKERGKYCVLWDLQELAKPVLASQLREQQRENLLGLV